MNIRSDETEDGLRDIVEGMFRLMISDPKIISKLDEIMLDLAVNRRELFVLGFECGVMMAMKQFKNGSMKLAANG